MKVHEFKIYPFRREVKGKRVWDKTCWWLVQFYQSPKALQTASAKRCKVCKKPIDKGTDHLGLTHMHHAMERIDTYGNVSDPKLKGELGIIFIQKKNCGGGVVSHECCHAMLYTVTRYTHVINAVSPLFHETDEQMAQILGNFCNQIFVEIDKKNLA